VFRHRFDPSSLVAAVIFLGVAWRYLGGDPPVWVVPGVAVALVVISVLRLLFRSRRPEP
jgi:TRAP-type C4-dicarboxylate transport system permease small subunit